MRVRILFGTMLLIVGLAVYALAVMRAAVAVLPDHWLAQVVFYGVAGTIWLYPAARLTRWMQDLPPPAAPR